MKKRETISDYELLALIYKSIDIETLKEQDKAVTKKRVDKLFQDLKGHVKKDDPDISEEEITGASDIKKDADLIVVNVDGASKGNPGESGIGVAIFDKDLNLINEACDYLGVATNNVAEYKALILGIKLSTKYNAKRVLFKADSELMVKQIKGEYRVKNAQLKLLFTEAQGLLKKLPNWKIMHVPREENKEADLLANKGVEMSIKSG
jgi:ribonuclease HI